MAAIAKRCIVGGSGVAGLMATRLASDFFDEDDYYRDYSEFSYAAKEASR